MVKSYEISRLEEHENVVDIESYLTPLSAKAGEEALESEFLSFPTDKALVFPRHGTRQSDVRFSGPLYDDIPGETSIFLMHSRTTSDQRFGEWTITHYYAKDIHPCSPPYTLTISNPAKHRLRYPLMAADSHHMCWIATVGAQTRSRYHSNMNDGLGRRLFMVRFADAHKQPEEYQPRVLKVCEKVLCDAVDIWLRMDVAAVVIHTCAEKDTFHWISLA